MNGHRIRQSGRIVPSQKACQKQGMLRSSRHAVKSNFAGDGGMLPKPFQSVDRPLKFDIVNVAGVPEIASFGVTQWVGGKATHRQSESVVRIPAGQAAFAAMQGKDAWTALFALPFVLAIAGKGWREALSEDPHLRNGLNIYAGSVTHPAVARDLQLPLLPAAQALT